MILLLIYLAVTDWMMNKVGLLLKHYSQTWGKNTYLLKNTNLMIFFFSVEAYTGVLYLNEKSEFDNITFSMLTNLTVAHEEKHLD